MSAKARRTNAELTTEERAAVGELMMALDVLLESEENKPDERLQCLCALTAERIAIILRGETELHQASDEELRSFARQWEADTPARFTES